MQSDSTEGMHSLCIKMLPKSQWQILRRRAADEGRTVAAQVRYDIAEANRRYLRRQNGTFSSEEREAVTTP